MAKNETTVTDASNAFPKLLSELRKGGAQDDASTKLAEVVRAVREICKPGELIIKLKITPAGSGQIVTITDEITAKIPKPDKEATLLFATEDGALQRDNPEQQTFNLRTVTTEPKGAPAKDVTEEKPALKSVAH